MEDKEEHAKKSGRPLTVEEAKEYHGFAARGQQPKLGEAGRAVCCYSTTVVGSESINMPVSRNTKKMLAHPRCQGTVKQRRLWRMNRTHQNLRSQPPCLVSHESTLPRATADVTAASTGWTWAL